MRERGRPTTNSVSKKAVVSYTWPLRFLTISVTITTISRDHHGPPAKSGEARAYDRYIVSIAQFDEPIASIFFQKSMFSVPWTCVRCFRQSARIALNLPRPSLPRRAVSTSIYALFLDQAHETNSFYPSPRY